MFTQLSRLRLHDRIITTANSSVVNKRQENVIRGAVEVAFFRTSDYDWFSYGGKKSRSFAFAGRKFCLKPGEVYALSRSGLSGRRALLIPSQSKRMFAMIKESKATALSRRSSPWKGSPRKFLADWDFRR